jgi:hypothetical protein
MPNDQGMTNDECPMTKECLIPNDECVPPARRSIDLFGIWAWAFFGHWELVIGHSPQIPVAAADDNP